MTALTHRHIIAFLSIMVTLIPLGALIRSIYCGSWEAATTYATLFVGLIAADVVVWQGYLIKRQLAFPTYPDLDKEWNSKELIEARQAVRAPGNDEWNHSRLEGILEFFEKLASMFKLSGDMPFIYQSTLGWYAAQYFLFARRLAIPALRGKREAPAKLSRVCSLACTMPRATATSHRGLTLAIYTGKRRNLCFSIRF